MSKINAKNAIQKIALLEGRTIQEVREEMMKAMKAGLESDDPKVKSMWDQIPCKGETPTLEEVIIHMAKHISK